MTQGLKSLALTGSGPEPFKPQEQKFLVYVFEFQIFHP